jgi:hypothetical protein
LKVIRSAVNRADSGRVVRDRIGSGPVPERNPGFDGGIRGVFTEISHPRPNGIQAALA